MDREHEQTQQTELFKEEKKGPGSSLGAEGLDYTVLESFVRVSNEWEAQGGTRIRTSRW